MRLPILLACVAAMVALSVGEASAQMFGSRPQGMSAATNTSSEGSLLRGSERFIRGNRRQSNFVGNDARDRRGFVGTQQRGATTPQAAPATALGRLLRSSRVSAAPAEAVGRAKGAYQPRLAVGFDVPQRSSQEVSAAVTRQLAAVPGLNPASRIEVSVEAGVATLRGAVASERDRTLIERLVLFEPGISAVRNDLKVVPPQPDAAPPPPGAHPQPSRTGPAPAYDH